MIISENGSSFSDHALLRRHVIAEFEQDLDVSQRLRPSPDATNGDVAVVKQAVKYRLIDVDALDFVHVHLDGESQINPRL
jgi:hypothetical protein